MSIERGTIQITISERVGRSHRIKDRFAKRFARWAAKLTSSKINWEARN